MCVYVFYDRQCTIIMFYAILKGIKLIIFHIFCNHSSVLTTSKTFIFNFERFWHDIWKYWKSLSGKWTEEYSNTLDVVKQTRTSLSTLDSITRLNIYYFSVPIWWYLQHVRYVRLCICENCKHSHFSHYYL